jgi:hypothetical protein
MGLHFLCPELRLFSIWGQDPGISSAMVYRYPEFDHQLGIPCYTIYCKKPASRNLYLP